MSWYEILSYMYPEATYSTVFSIYICVYAYIYIHILRRYIYPSHMSSSSQIIQVF